MENHPLELGKGLLERHHLRRDTKVARVDLWRAGIEDRDARLFPESLLRRVRVPGVRVDPVRGGGRFVEEDARGPAGFWPAGIRRNVREDLGLGALAVVGRDVPDDLGIGQRLERGRGGGVDLVRLGLQRISKHGSDSSACYSACRCKSSRWCLANLRSPRRARN